MATTTNFGWTTPNDTDLVKDGAAAIRTLGQSIDTSMMDLKGGTTGQVLAKNSNTDMDFVWSADAAGMTNPMTTTGDTIYSSSGSTPARRAIGTTGQVLTVSGGLPTWATPASPAAVGVMLRLTSTTGISNGTSTTLDFTTELFDTDSFHDNSTNPSRITIPAGKGGKYLVTASTGWDSGASGDRQYRVFKNGSLLSGTPNNTWQNVSTSTIGQPYAYVFNLVATDYLEFNVVQYSGSSITISSANTTFGAMFLGA
jgi:hypothetical protein